jgi:hypothetical protein
LCESALQSCTNLRPDSVSELIRRIEAAEGLWHISAPDVCRSVRHCEYATKTWDDYTHTKQTDKPGPGEDLRIHIEIDRKRISGRVYEDVRGLFTQLRKGEVVFIHGQKEMAYTQPSPELASVSQ